MHQPDMEFPRAGQYFDWNPPPSPPPNPPPSSVKLLFKRVTSLSNQLFTPAFLKSKEDKIAAQKAKTESWFSPEPTFEELNFIFSPEEMTVFEREEEARKEEEEETRRFLEKIRLETESPQPPLVNDNRSTSSSISTTCTLWSMMGVLPLTDPDSQKDASPEVSAKLAKEDGVSELVSEFKGNVMTKKVVNTERIELQKKWLAENRRVQDPATLIEALKKIHVRSLAIASLHSNFPRPISRPPPLPEEWVPRRPVAELKPKPDSENSAPEFGERACDLMIYPDIPQEEFSLNHLEHVNDPTRYTSFPRYPEDESPPGSPMTSEADGDSRAASPTLSESKPRLPAPSDSEPRAPAPSAESHADDVSKSQFTLTCDSNIRSSFSETASITESQAVEN